jgi:hypothetical protein
MPKCVAVVKMASYEKEEDRMVSMMEEVGKNVTASWLEGSWW